MSSKLERAKARRTAVVRAGVRNGELGTEHVTMVDEHEAAWLMKLSPRTLQDWRRLSRQGKPRGPAWVTIEGAVRYRIRDIEDWIAQHRDPGASGPLEAAR